MQDRLSWSIWLYKDIGFQGMVYVSRETPYMTLFRDFLAKKHRLAIDAWGADDSHVRATYEPLVNLIKNEIKPEHQQLYPAPVWKLTDRIGRLARSPSNWQRAPCLIEMAANEEARQIGAKALTAINEYYARAVHPAPVAAIVAHEAESLVKSRRF